MKNLLIVCGIVMVVLAIWQCDARANHGDDHRHHKRENKTEKVVLKVDNGKVLVVNVLKSKVNVTKDRPKILFDEDGNPIFKHGRIEIEVEKKNNGTFKGKLRKKNITSSEVGNATISPTSLSSSSSFGNSDVDDANYDDGSED